MKDHWVSFSVQLSHFDPRDGGAEILREIWTVTVREVEDDRYQFDLDSRQSLVGKKPLEIEKYHYGGMAFFSSKIAQTTAGSSLRLETGGATDCQSFRLLV